VHQLQLSGPAFACGSRRSAAVKHAALLTSPTAIHMQAMCVDLRPSCCNVGYACGPGAQASQRVTIVEPISAHVSITPAHVMPAALFQRFCSTNAFNIGNCQQKQWALLWARTEESGHTQVKSANADSGGSAHQGSRATMALLLPFMFAVHFGADCTYCNN